MPESKEISSKSLGELGFLNSLTTSATLGWLPVHSKQEEIIIQYLEQLGVQQLVLVNKLDEWENRSRFQLGTTKRLYSDNSLNEDHVNLLQRKCSLNLSDSSFKHKRMK